MKDELVRLLIVDGKETNREVLTCYLERQDRMIAVSEDGIQALEMIQAQQFDLVLLNVDTPKLNGYQVLEQLKTDGVLGSMPVIMLADVDEIACVERCIELGARDYLLEPFNSVLLKVRLARCLDNQRLNKQLLLQQYESKVHKNLERLASDLMRVVLPLGIAMSAERNFDQLIERIVLESISLCHANGGAFYLRTEDEHLQFSVVRNDSLGIAMGGTSGKAVSWPSLSLYDDKTGTPNYHNVSTYVALTGESINIPDTYSNEEFDFSGTKAIDKENGYRTISSLAVPLKDADNRVIGVLQLINAQNPETGEIIYFDSYSQQVVESLASQAAIALNNQLLMKRHENLLKFERDVQIGQRIQADFFPLELPKWEGWEIDAYFCPARNVAGDFYDSFTLAQNRRIGLVIADVCDKGVGAALFMALIRSLIRAFAQQRHSSSVLDVLSVDNSEVAFRRSNRGRRALSMGIDALKNSVELTNNYVANTHAELSMFATLFFGVLDPGTGLLTYINAGHEAPVILGPDGVHKEKLSVTGPAVGVFPDATFKIDEAQLQPGDILFAYTDGMTDAKNQDGRKFGREQLFSCVKPPIGSAASLLNQISDAVQTYIGNADQFDDLTMLAVRRAPSPGA